MLLSNKYAIVLCSFFLLISFNEVISHKNSTSELKPHSKGLLQKNQTAQESERVTNSVTGSVTGWTPEALVKLTLPNSYLFTPDFNFKKEYMADLNMLANILIDKFKFDLKIYVVSKISDEYLNPDNNKINIEKFTNNLAYLLYKDKATDSNSLIIVISIDDRKVRIRTGAKVSHDLSNSDISYVINQMLVEFRQKKYEDAVLVGVDLIVKIVSGDFSTRGRSSKSGTHRETTVSIGAIIIVIFLLLFLVLLLYICIELCSRTNRRQVIKTKIDDSGLERLKKIKTSLNRNLPPCAYLEKTCIICIEDFKGDIHPENASLIRPDELILDCGHRFHKSCIETWFDKQKSCPTCREKLFEADQNSEVKFSNGLVNIHTHYYPNLASVQYTYYDYDLIWDTNPEYQYVDYEYVNDGGYSGGYSGGYGGGYDNDNGGYGGGDGGNWNDYGGGMDCDVGGGSGDW